MFKRLGLRAAFLALAIAVGPVFADVVTFGGNLGDPANAALVASDLSAPRFADDLDTANNVALHTLHVAVGGNVSFASTGFAAGGVDPYFTLFIGTDPATATVLDSNYLNATTLGGDFTIDVALAPGDYTVAIGVYSNLSFAENLGGGVLADGFIGLGVPAFFGDGSYALTITLPGGTTVPEPAGAALTLAAAWAAAAARRRRQDQVSNGGR